MDAEIVVALAAQSKRQSWQCLAFAVKMREEFVAAVQLSSPCRGGVRCLWHVVSPWLLAPLPSSYAYGVSTPNPRAAATAMLLPAPPPFHPYSYQRVEGTLLCSDAEGSKNIMVVALRPHLLPWGARWGTPGYGGPHHPAMVLPSFYLSIPCMASPSPPSSAGKGASGSTAGLLHKPSLDTVSWRIGSRRVGLGSSNLSHPY